MRKFALHLLLCCCFYSRLFCSVFFFCPLTDVLKLCLLCVSVCVRDTQLESPKLTVPSQTAASFNYSQDENVSLCSGNKRLLQCLVIVPFLIYLFIKTFQNTKTGSEICIWEMQLFWRLTEHRNYNTCAYKQKNASASHYKTRTTILVSHQQKNTIAFTAVPLYFVILL